MISVYVLFLTRLIAIDRTTLEIKIRFFRPLVTSKSGILHEGFPVSDWRRMKK